MEKTTLFVLGLLTLSSILDIASSAPYVFPDCPQRCDGLPSDPVCAIDKKTYDNGCLRKCEGVKPGNINLF